MNNSKKAILWIAWLALMGWGLTGIYGRITTGHELANYGSYVPWGLWVSAYIYFIGLSAGAFLISSLIYVFGFEKLKGIGRLALFTAAVTLVLALISIWLDLGHMWRFYEIFTRPNFSSMMTWMVWLYTAYFLLILAELWLDMRCDVAGLAASSTGVRRTLYRIVSLGWSCPTDAGELEACHAKSMRWMRVLGGIGVPLAIAFHGGVGALFATLSTRPYWNQSLFPILFLTGALVSGGGLLLAMLAFTRAGKPDDDSTITLWLSRIVLGLLVFDLILEWAETSIPIWYGVGPEFELYKVVLFGRFWWVFWLVHILLGSAIPIVLLVWKPASRQVAGLAGGLIAVTYLAVRLNLVIPGLITPALEGLAEAYVDPRLVFDYVPSAYEWSVVAFVIALGFLIFYLGYRFLPLKETDAPMVAAVQARN